MHTNTPVGLVNTATNNSTTGMMIDRESFRKCVSANNTKMMVLPNNDSVITKTSHRALSTHKTNNIEAKKAARDELMSSTNRYKKNTDKPDSRV